MKFSIVTITLIFALSATASAESNYYFAVTVGQTYSNLCPSTNKLQYGCVNSGDAGEFAGGYTINPNLGVELSYKILGTYAAYDGNSSGTDGAATSYTKAGGFAATAVGNYELYKNLSLIGKLGLADIMITQPSQAGTHTATNTNIFYGLGMQYAFTKSVAGRVVWENLGTVGNGDTGESRMSMISGGLVFKY
jgi:opacity protein-like surface antigen